MTPVKGPKAGPRKGEKSRRWDQDPVILARLEAVSQMLLRGAKLWQVAEAFQYSITTAKHDFERVRALWGREAQDAVTANRDRSVAQIRAVQMMAWDVYQKDKTNLGALREIRECEKQIIDLQGTRSPLVVAELDLARLSDAELIEFIQTKLAELGGAGDRARGDGGGAAGAPAAGAGVLPGDAPG